MWRNECGGILWPIAECKSAVVYPVPGAQSGHGRDICLYRFRAQIRYHLVIHNGSIGSSEYPSRLSRGLALPPAPLLVLRPRQATPAPR